MPTKTFTSTVATDATNWNACFALYSDDNAAIPEGSVINSVKYSFDSNVIRVSSTTNYTFRFYAIALYNGPYTTTVQTDTVANTVTATVNFQTAKSGNTSANPTTGSFQGGTYYKYRQGTSRTYLNVVDCTFGTANTNIGLINTNPIYAKAKLDNSGGWQTQITKLTITIDYFVPTAPSTPTSFAISNSAPYFDNNVNLSWAFTAPSNNPFSTFIVQYADNSSFNNATQINVSNKYWNSIAKPGTIGGTYYYRVKAVCAYSSSGWTSAVSCSPVVQPTKQPTSVSASPNSGSIWSGALAPKITWSGASGYVNNAISKYQVYRSTSASSVGSVVKDNLSASTTNWTDSISSAGTYYYRVKAVGAQSTGTFNTSTAYAKVTVSGPSVTTPSNFKINNTAASSTAIIARSFSLTWSASSASNAGTNPTITYHIKINGTEVGTTTSTSYTVGSPSSYTSNASVLVYATIANNGVTYTSGNSTTGYIRYNTITAPSGLYINSEGLTGSSSSPITAATCTLHWTHATMVSGTPSYNVYKGSTKLNSTAITGNSYTVGSPNSYSTAQGLTVKLVNYESTYYTGTVYYKYVASIPMTIDSSGGRLNGSGRVYTIGTKSGNTFTGLDYPSNTISAQINVSFYAGFQTYGSSATYKYKFEFLDANNTVLKTVTDITYTASGTRGVVSANVTFGPEVAGKIIKKIRITETSSPSSNTKHSYGYTSDNNYVVDNGYTGAVVNPPSAVKVNSASPSTNTNSPTLFTSLGISWTAGSTSGIPGSPAITYKVFVSGTEVWSGTATSCTITGTSYTSSTPFTVRAYATYSGTTYGSTVVGPYYIKYIAPPSKPTASISNATPYFDNNVNLTWQDCSITNNKVTKYEIQYSSSSSFSSVTTLNVTTKNSNNNVVTYYNSIPKPTTVGGTYYYRVRAHGTLTGAVSAWSNTVSCSPTIKPAKHPTSVSITPTSGNIENGAVSVTLSWSGAAGYVNNPIARYAIYRSTSASSIGSRIYSDISASTTSKTFNVSTTGTFYYRVMTDNEVTETFSASNPYATLSIVGPSVSVPSAVKINTGNPSTSATSPSIARSFVLSWTASTISNVSGTTPTITYHIVIDDVEVGTTTSTSYTVPSPSQYTYPVDYHIYATFVKNSTTYSSNSTANYYLQYNTITSPSGLYINETGNTGTSANPIKAPTCTLHWTASTATSGATVTYDVYIGGTKINSSAVSGTSYTVNNPSQYGSSTAMYVTVNGSTTLKSGTVYYRYISSIRTTVDTDAGGLNAGRTYTLGTAPGSSVTGISYTSDMVSATIDISFYASFDQNGTYTYKLELIDQNNNIVQTVSNLSATVSSNRAIIEFTGISVSNQFAGKFIKKIKITETASPASNKHSYARTSESNYVINNGYNTGSVSKPTNVKVNNATASTTSSSPTIAHTFTVTWSASTATDIPGTGTIYYKLYINGSVVYNGTSTSYAIPDASAYTSSTPLYVRAYKDYNSVAYGSANSTTYYIQYADISLTKPGNPSVSQDNMNQLNISWTASTGSYGTGSISYVAQIMSGSTVLYSSSSVSGTSTTINITTAGMSYGSAYAVRIKATYSGLTQYNSTNTSITPVQPTITMGTITINGQSGSATGTTAVVEWGAATQNAYTSGTIKYYLKVGSGSYNIQTSPYTLDNPSTYSSGVTIYVYAKDDYAQSAVVSVVFTFSGGSFKYYNGSTWVDCEVYYYDSSYNQNNGWRKCSVYYNDNGTWKQ